MMVFTETFTTELLKDGFPFSAEILSTLSQYTCYEIIYVACQICLNYVKALKYSCFAFIECAFIPDDQQSSL